jgi:hypothetical protein
MSPLTSTVSFTANAVLTPLPEAEGRTKATATPTPTQAPIRNRVTRRHHAKRAFVIAAS